MKLIPEHLATFKVVGSPGGPHYGHQDLISGRTVCMINFTTFIIMVLVFWLYSSFNSHYRPEAKYIH